MSHDKPSDDLPDFNAFFKNELGPCKAPRKKPKPDEFPPHLRPGNPDRWDDRAKHYAALWRLELIKEIEAGHKTPPKDLADACEEYARLCFVYGSAGEVVALAKMALRQLGNQPEERKQEGIKHLNLTYQRVIQLAIGCGFYVEASSFIRYAIELGELMCRDALTREESCGGHFREEYQHPDGECKRDDEKVAHVAAWEYQGEGKTPLRNTEALVYEQVKMSVRKYK